MESWQLPLQGGFGVSDCGLIADGGMAGEIAAAATAGVIGTLKSPERSELNGKLREHGLISGRSERNHKRQDCDRRGFRSGRRLRQNLVQWLCRRHEQLCLGDVFIHSGDV